MSLFIGEDLNRTVSSCAIPFLEIHTEALQRLCAPPELKLTIKLTYKKKMTGRSECVNLVSLSIETLV